MSTFLFIWNHDNWPWAYRSEQLAAFEQDGVIKLPWSCLALPASQRRVGQRHRPNGDSFPLWKRPVNPETGQVQLTHHDR